MAQYTQGLYQSIIKSRVFQFLSHRLDTRLVGGEGQKRWDMAVEAEDIQLEMKEKKSKKIFDFWDIQRNLGIHSLKARKFES